MNLSRNTRQNSSGPQANSSTLCDRPKATNADGEDQSFTETPPDHYPARPHVNQLGSSDAGATGTGEAAGSPERSHFTTSERFVHQLNGSYMSFGTSGTINNVREIHDGSSKEGWEIQHNGPTFVFERGTTKYSVTRSGECNNPTMYAGASQDGDGKKIKGIQHNGPRIENIWKLYTVLLIEGILS
ncbi:hypothetical protein FMUND_12391 [Fusarium mundagurra]|uniref:Uncharacterized protein n=1 Tax=Fusarium mundagurra TaxID=1567541 RepID=A0A8H5Y2L6_9HYPO|nr:hypothetical protein FMUND_12391 [Fusarium mundagurra]